MSVIVALALQINNQSSAQNLEDFINSEASSSAGRIVKVSISNSVLKRINILQSQDNKIIRDGLRDKGSSFIPNFHVIVPDQKIDASHRWTASLNPGIMNALFSGSPGMGSISHLPSTQQANSTVEEKVPLHLGFTLTIGTMMLLGTVDENGIEEPSLSFNILAPSGNSTQQAVVKKNGPSVSVTLPNGNTVEIPPAFIVVMNNYLSIISSIPAA